METSPYSQEVFGVFDQCKIHSRFKSLDFFRPTVDVLGTPRLQQMEVTTSSRLVGGPHKGNHPHSRDAQTTHVELKFALTPVRGVSVTLHVGEQPRDASCNLTYVVL
jgi:hypothetical protein